ncbi:hypothetical protein HYC85_010320 [Camellia sinensis]|uniref:Uncharacterized protein n=1 Tax=Camellia sinensis TaxID=4442 RepID=A0A7J7HKB6_CAMSI|nr:hypothetical protein HYC85_010320 [Camellia sinensis]
MQDNFICIFVLFHSGHVKIHDFSRVLRLKACNLSKKAHSLLLQRAGFDIPYLGYHLLHLALKHYYGDRMMDYINLDDRSIGMLWVVSYTMAQPACETVMNWLTSAGVQELLPGSNLQSTERLMVMREVWDLVTGRLLQTQAFPLPITAIVVDPTEMKLFSGGIDY